LVSGAKEVKVSQLISALQRSSVVGGSQFPDRTVRVLTYVDSSMGPQPSVVIKDIAVGIDWDRGSLFFVPEQPLSKYPFVTDEELSEFKKLNRQRMDYKTYEKLTGEIKSLKQRIKELEGSK
jgi:hypothetical protein